jgi:hypothetical protein
MVFKCFKGGIQEREIVSLYSLLLVLNNWLVVVVVKIVKCFASWLRSNAQSTIQSHRYFCVSRGDTYHVPGMHFH